MIIVNANEPAVLDKRIKLDEVYEDEEYGTTTVYFTAPKEYVADLYPNAESTEISLEFPTNKPIPSCVSVEMSPTEEIDGTYTDYDWFDVDIPNDEIELLLNLWLKETDKHK